MRRSIFTFVLVLLGIGLFAQNTVFQENFESTPLSVTSSSSGSGVWALNTRVQSQGLKSDSCVVTASTTTYLTTNSFSTVGKYSVTLEFDQICKISFFDTAYVQYSLDNGATFTNIDGAYYLGTGGYSTSGNRFTGLSDTSWHYQDTTELTNNMWKTEAFDLSNIAANASSVIIRFALIDGSFIPPQIGSEGFPGWFIDSLHVEASFSELIPPTVTQLNPIIQDTAYSAGPYDVGAYIFDASGLDTAYCVYSVMPGNIIDTLPMILDVATTDSFYCSIPFYGFGRTISYYVKAIDASYAHNTDSTATKSFFCKNSPGGTFVVGDLNNTASGTGSNPFGQFYTGNKEQFLILASELQAMGAAGGNLTSIGFNVTSANAATSSGSNHDGFTIKIKSTSSSVMTTTFETGLTQVYSTSSYQTVVGWNTFNFTAPFVWDGVSNIIIETCFDNGSSNWSSNATLYTTTTTFNSTTYKYSDGASNECNETSGTPTANRPDIQLVLAAPSGLTNDIGVYSVLSPTGGVLNGASYDIDVNIKNYGVDTLTSAWVNWTFDGTMQTPYQFTDSLFSDSISASLTLDTKNATSGSHIIKAWTDSVNGGYDNDISNDTASFSFYGCSSLLAGTYTIGGSGADYPTFADAALALNQCGISAPVTFNIAAGTYNEQMELMPVNGSSATNTITFQSATADSSAVTLTYDATGTVDNYVVKLNGTAYITFKNMTIEAQDTTYARAIVITDGAHDVSLLNNVIKTTYTTMLDDDNMALVLATDSLGANMIVNNNVLMNGSWAVSLYGDTAATNWQVNNNIIHGHYAKGVSISNAVSAQVNNNDIMAEVSSNAASYNGIVLINNSGSAQVTMNKLLTKATEYAYGISFENCAFDSLNHSQIVNNFVQLNGNTTSNNLSAGILIFETPNVDVYFNNVRLSGSQTNATSISLYDATAGITNNINVVNNIFANNAGGFIYYNNNVDTANFVNHNNNLYNYNLSGVFAYQGANVSDFAAWVAATGAVDCDTVIPYFTSATDLHVANNLLNGRAVPIAGITTDIDGDVRDTQNPDFGADEFLPSPWDVTTLEVLSPIGSCGLDSNEVVTVRYKNIGSATINGNFTASYKLIGGTTVTENVTDSIQPGDTLDFSFAATANLNVQALGADSTFILKAWGDLTGDNVPYNDTTLSNVFAGYVPGLPTVIGDTVNYGNSAMIQAQGNSTYFWATDTSSNFLAKDSIYITPVLYDTTTYWVNDRAGAGIDSITVGTGSVTNTHLPLEMYYGYTYSQTIYKASYLNNKAGYIKSITYTYQGGSYTDAIKVYVGTTNKTSFSGVTDWIPITDLSLVYDGNITYNSGQLTINFTTPFSYNGVDNLVVAWDENTSGYHSSSDEFLNSNLDTDVKSIYFYNDNTNPDPANPPTSGFSLGTSTNSPNAVFEIDAAGCFGTKVPVTVIVENIPLHDIGVTTLSSPNSGIDLSANENVTVMVKNFAAVSKDTIPVAYMLDTLPMVRDTLFQTLAFGDSAIFTFGQQADLSSYITHDLKVFTSLGYDQNHNNDTLAAQITNSMLQYCSCSATYTGYEDITNVSLSNINNTTQPVGAMYNDYTTSVPMAVLAPGQSYPISVSTDFPSGYSNSYNTWVNVFIDYNHDGVFNPNTELAYSAPSSSSNTVTGTVVVPSTGIVSGMPSRMRVAMRESGNQGNTGPCGTFSWGEVEDYTIIIVPPIPSDAGIAGISPVGTVYTTGPTSMFVDVKNYGLDSLVKATIGWQVDTLAQPNVPWTGLEYKDSIDYNFAIGNYTFTNGPHTVKAWTSLPNDSVDLHAFNDTLTINVYGCPNSLNGTYTLGSPTSDFPTFADAFNTLENCGVSGNVVINIDSGSYTGQLVVGSYPGVSDTSTVVFQSATGDSSSVVIQYAPAGSSDNFVVNFDNSKYVSFKDVTMKSTSATYGRVLVFSGYNHHLSIENSVIEAPSGTSSNLVPVYNGGVGDTAISFVNNDIKNGYYGIYWRGSSSSDRDFGSVFRNNSITGFYYYGAYLYYQDSVIFENNIVENDPGLGSSSAYGVYNYYDGNAYRFTGNKINISAGSYTSYGIYVYNGIAIDTARALIANNMISISSGSTQYGIYTSYSSYVDVYYNSVNVHGSGTNSRAFYTTGGTSQKVMNNVFSNITGNGHAAYYSSTSAIDTTDNNDYYSTGSNLAYWSGNQATLTDLRAANGMDTASVSVDPSFYNTDNLHTTSPMLSNAGSPVANVLYDYDGEMRDTLTPCIGADEFTPLAVDLGVVSLESPVSYQCFGANEAVTVRVRNFGTDTVHFDVDTAFVHASTTGVNPMTFPVVAISSGVLASGADTIVTISTSYDMSVSGSYTFNAYSNVNADSNNVNDPMSPVNMNVTSIITSYPFTEDFETFTAGNPGALANGWTRNLNSYKWQPNTGSTSSSSTGPMGDHTTGSGVYIYTEASSTGGDADLTSPCLDLTSFTNPVLKFWYHMYGATIGDLYIQALDVNSNWVDIDTISGQQQTASSDPWIQKAVALGQFTTGITKVRFHAVKGSSYTGDISIDDIYVNEPKQWDVGVSSILKPATNFAVAGSLIDTVIVKVENFGYDTITPSTGVTVSYQYDGQTPVTVAITDTIYPFQSKVININTPVSVLAGNRSLNAYTTFALDTVTNNDSTLSSFMGVGVKTLSYNNNFDGQVDFFGDNNSCWQRGIPNGSNINTAHSSPNVWMSDLNNGYPNDAYCYLYTPFFDFSSVQTGDTATLSFYNWIDVSSNDGGFVQYSTDGGSTWLALGYMGMTANEATNWYNTNAGGTHMWNATSTGWQYSSINLGQFTGVTSPVQFRFVFVSNTSGNSLDGWAIDNFKIALPQAANDVGFVSVDTPVGSAQTGSNITVSGTVKNFGSNTQTSFPVKYIVNGTPVTEVFTASGSGLLPDSTEQFTFSTSFVGPSTDFNICLTTALVGDVYPQNDSSCAFINATAAALDAGVVAVNVNPSWADTTKMTYQDTVHIKIVNFGLNTLTSIPVQYSRNTTVVGNGTWTGSLASGDTADYVFTTTYSSPVGNYTICAKTILPNDADASNDSKCHAYFGMNDVSVDNANGLVFSVDQNEPNPAFGNTRINYVIPQNGKVKFELRNALGQVLLSNEANRQVGNNTIDLDADKLSDGIYYYTIEFNNERITRKMIVNQ
jgi:hypothetical protein